MNDRQAQPYILPRRRLDALFDALIAQGYELIAPVRRDGAIMYEPVAKADELPIGWTDEQAPGRYRLSHRTDEAVFGYALGQDSWKRYLRPPRRRLWRAEREGGTLRVTPEPAPTTKRAFIGVRACELAAVKAQDRILRDGAYQDRDYAARREKALIVAVNCGAPSSSCFCTSMDTGPAVGEGHDIALTELLAAETHDFLCVAGSETGARIIVDLDLSPADDAAKAAAAAVIDGTKERISRRLETAGVQALLQDNPDHPHWDDVAERCLSCGNCTAVCPTCFCATIEDVTSLDGASSERIQHWDYCFTPGFSELGGAPVRASVKSRYRQWMTHKLSTWIDQFGESGCVGCGRCITWCPVGIDITAEAAAIRAQGDAAP